MNILMNKYDDDKPVWCVQQKIASFLHLQVDQMGNFIVRHDDVISQSLFFIMWSLPVPARLCFILCFLNVLLVQLLVQSVNRRISTISVPCRHIKTNIKRIKSNLHTRAYNTIGYGHLQAVFKLFSLE